MAGLGHVELDPLVVAIERRTWPFTYKAPVPLTRIVGAPALAYSRSLLTPVAGKPTLKVPCSTCSWPASCKSAAVLLAVATVTVAPLASTVRPAASLRT